jgi:hypothetical protein
MARTKSGALEITKTEAKNLRLLIEHSLRDISYNAGGTFALNPGMDDEVDAKEVAKVKDAIETLEWIIKVAEPL